MATFWATFGLILAIFILTSGHTGPEDVQCAPKKCFHSILFFAQIQTHARRDTLNAFHSASPIQL